MSNQVAVLETAENGKEYAVSVNPTFSAHNIKPLSDMSQMKPSQSVVTEYVSVMEWETRAKKGYSFWGETLGTEEFEVVDKQTGLMKRLKSVIFNGIWSKDGKTEAGESAKLYGIGQKQIVSTLEKFPLGLAWKITHTGAITVGEKRINQFEINELA